MSSNKIVFQLEAKKLLEKLRKYPDDVQDKVIKKSVRKGANLVKSDAKREAPKDTGLLKSKVTIRQARKKSNLSQFVMIVNVKAPHHHLIELGTDDREPKKGKFLVFENKQGQEIFVKKVKGVKANPFLGRAYEKNKDKVLTVFQEELKKQISKL